MRFPDFLFSSYSSCFSTNSSSASECLVGLWKVSLKILNSWIILKTPKYLWLKWFKTSTFSVITDVPFHKHSNLIYFAKQWPWKLGQGHQNPIKSSLCTNLVLICPLDQEISGLKLRVLTEKKIFLFLNQNICCVDSKESSQWDGSFECPKHLLKLMGKEIFTI